MRAALAAGAYQLQPLGSYRYLQGTSDVAGIDDVKGFEGLKVCARAD